MKNWLFSVLLFFVVGNVLYGQPSEHPMAVYKVVLVGDEVHCYNKNGELIHILSPPRQLPNRLNEIDSAYHPNIENYPPGGCTFFYREQLHICQCHIQNENVKIWEFPTNYCPSKDSQLGWKIEGNTIIIEYEVGNGFRRFDKWKWNHQAKQFELQISQA